jgi:hypothetical protein
VVEIDKARLADLARHPQVACIAPDTPDRTQ